MKVVPFNIFATICAFGFVSSALANCPLTTADATRSCIQTDDEIAMESLDRPANGVKQITTPAVLKAPESRSDFDKTRHYAREKKAPTDAPMAANQAPLSVGFEDGKVLERTQQPATH